MTTGFASALTGQPPAPCERGCPHVERCANERLSCYAFASYAVSNKNRTFTRRADDMPTRSLFSLHEMDLDPAKLKIIMRKLNAEHEAKGYARHVRAVNGGGMAS